MALESVSGRISEAEELLAKTLAASTTWQTLCGAANENEALAHVYFNSIPESADQEHAWDEYETMLPFAVVSTSQAGMRFSRVGVLAYAQGGVLGLAIEAKVPTASAANDQERARWWLNRVGGVMWDLLNKDSAAGYLTVENIQLEAWEFGPPENVEVQGFELARAMMTVSYGIAGGGE